MILSNANSTAVQSTDSPVNVDLIKDKYMVVIDALRVHFARKGGTDAHKNWLENLEAIFDETFNGLIALQKISKNIPLNGSCTQWTVMERHIIHNFPSDHVVEIFTDTSNALMRQAGIIFKKLQEGCFGIDHNDILNGLIPRTGPAPQIKRSALTRFERYLKGVHNEMKKKTDSLRIFLEKIAYSSIGGLTRLVALIKCIDDTRKLKSTELFDYMNKELTDFWVNSIKPEMSRLKYLKADVFNVSKDLKLFRNSFVKRINLVFESVTIDESPPSSPTTSTMPSIQITPATPTTPTAKPTDSDLWSSKSAEKATKLGIAFSELIESKLKLLKDEKLCQLLVHLKEIFNTLVGMDHAMYGFFPQIIKHEALEPLDVVTRKIFNQVSRRRRIIKFPLPNLVKAFDNFRNDWKNCVNELRKDLIEFILGDEFKHLFKIIINLKPESNLKVFDRTVNDFVLISEAFQSMSTTIVEVMRSMQIANLLRDLNRVRTMVAEVNNFDYLILRLTALTRSNPRVLLESQFIDLAVANDLLIKAKKTVREFLDYQKIFKDSIAKIFKMEFQADNDRSDSFDLMYLDKNEFDLIINDKVQIYERNEKLNRFLIAVKTLIDQFNEIIATMTDIKGFCDWKHHQNLQLSHKSKQTIYNELNEKLHALVNICDNPLFAELSLLIGFIHDDNVSQLNKDSLEKFANECEHLIKSTKVSWTSATYQNFIAEVFSAAEKPDKLKELTAKHEASSTKLTTDLMITDVKNAECKIKEIIAFLREMLLSPGDLQADELNEFKELSAILPFICELYENKPIEPLVSPTLGTETPMDRVLTPLSNVYFGNEAIDSYFTSKPVQHDEWHSRGRTMSSAMPSYASPASNDKHNDNWTQISKRPMSITPSHPATSSVSELTHIEQTDKATLFKNILEDYTYIYMQGSNKTNLNDQFYDAFDTGTINGCVIL